MVFDDGSSQWECVSATVRDSSIGRFMDQVVYSRDITNIPNGDLDSRALETNRIQKLDPIRSERGLASNVQQVCYEDYSKGEPSLVHSQLLHIIHTLMPMAFLTFTRPLPCLATGARPMCSKSLPGIAVFMSFWRASSGRTGLLLFALIKSACAPAMYGVAMEVPDTIEQENKRSSVHSQYKSSG